MNLHWSEPFRRLFQLHLPEGPGKVRKGIYHFRREASGNVTRFHLRVEEDGAGLLLANSSVAAKLSPSGVMIAKALLEGKTAPEIEESIRKNFRDVKEAFLKSDLAKLSQFIETLANPEDNYPIFNLDDPAVSTAHGLFAPFHAQLSVASPEKTNPLLGKLWENGIIHVTFAAVGSSSPDEAVQNIERAGDLGMISGLRAVASWLRSPDLLRRIAVAGVDYVTIPILSSDSQKHDAIFGANDFTSAQQSIGDCKKWEICPVAEIPLFQDNFADLESLLHKLRSWGVKNVLYYAIANEHQSSGLNGVEIIQVAALVHELAHLADVRYVWQPPVSRKGELRELLEAGPRTAGDVSVRVEPDGSVYAARGPAMAAGNLLTDEWEKIWNHEAFRKYRQRVESPTRCDICPGLEICAADCPGDPRGWASGEEK